MAAADPVAATVIMEENEMHRTVVATLIAGSLVMVGMAADARTAAPSPELQQQLIALDKQWGEAGTTRPR